MLKTVTFQVNDMHCDSCPKLIKMSLEESRGVSQVDASLATHLVTVAYDSNQTDPSKLAAVIKANGYTPIIS